MDFRNELNEYIVTLISRSASDLHLVVNSKPLFRADREIIPFIQKEVLTETDTEGFLAILLGKPVDTARELLKEKKHILFSFSHTVKDGVTVNFRGTAYLERKRIAIALRLVPLSERTIVDLNLPTILESVTKEPQGLFLVVGPAGNGKSTTMAAMINQINKTSRQHILTIEDPVEFVFKNNEAVITQREIPRDALTFRSALDSALRADADILMIGEMREVETMQAVMTAAEVGHLVFSTVHANSAAQTIDRIIDSFPVGQQQQIAIQLSAALLGVCSIRLLPRISGGLIPACEILLNTNAIANLIREKRTAGIETVIQTSREDGMVSLEQALANLVRGNEIDLRTAQRFSRDDRILSKYL